MVHIAGDDERQVFTLVTRGRRRLLFNGDELQQPLENVVVGLVLKPFDKRASLLRSDTGNGSQQVLRLRGKEGWLLWVGSHSYEVVQGVSRQQTLAHVLSAERNTECIEQAVGFHVTRFFHRLHDVGSRLLLEAVKSGYLLLMFWQMIDVGIVLDPSQVDEPLQCLFRDAVDIHSFF